jgi:predicted aspartyl protease
MNEAGRTAATAASILALLGLVALPALTAATVQPDPAHRRGAVMPRDTTVARLLELYAHADFFALRARLESMDSSDDARVHFLRAAAAHAFNDPANSNGRLARLPAETGALPDSLQVEAHRLRLRNHLRLHQYDAGLEAARTLLALPALDSTTRAGVENEARALGALAGAPAQRVMRRAATEIVRGADGRVPLLVGDSARSYAMDTGANMSLMMRSEAVALGLAIRSAGVEVATSTGSRVTADIAVAPRLVLGEVELADVVFLVVPDELLTFGLFRIPGLIGFPVLDALGEVEFRGGGVLRIPAQVPVRHSRNLALRFLTPLVTLTVLDLAAVCVLDTGARTTALHLPFYERHRPWVEGAGVADTVTVVGVGGGRRMQAYVLSDVLLSVGGAAVTLPRVPVYTESVAAGQQAADCVLGLDVLNELGGYIMNLRSMAFLALGPAS